ncbi:MAG TPA: hypothetical protein P5186_13905 [Candidatus Paceibacterota bacterium]|nr:hypothetical protein [Verrucomicrobiota bacterium]HRY49138.1 hypothetical protein [Candidatus Paceibacterota bacterium]HRZ99833.1 hypothetical protein [Candidatus Paceibacterota bacterium]
MKAINNLLTVAVVALGLASATCLAAQQGASSGGKQGQSEGSPGAGAGNAGDQGAQNGGDQGQSGEAPGANENAGGQGEVNSENKGRPPEFARPALPEDVKKLFTDLETQRKTFTDTQKELAKQMKDASAEQREVLRDKMKENRETFKETQRALREDIRDRLAEMRKEFANNRDKVLEEAKEQAKERKGNRKGSD